MTMYLCLSVVILFNRKVNHRMKNRALWLLQLRNLISFFAKKVMSDNICEYPIARILIGLARAYLSRELINIDLRGISYIVI